MENIDKFIEDHISSRADKTVKKGISYQFYFTIDRKKTIIKTCVDKDKLKKYAKKYILEENYLKPYAFKPAPSLRQ